MSLPLLLASCIRVEHLGDNTGEAFREVFAIQVRGARVHKPMEAELGRVATEKMLTSDSGKRTRSVYGGSSGYSAGGRLGGSGGAEPKTMTMGSVY